MKALDSFDLKSYAQWLVRVQAQRPILPASQLDELPEPYLRLQHDIDVNLAWAAVVAEVEATAAVRSTYCVMVGADFYELTTGIGMASLQAILSFDHDLGLHFDWRRYEEAGLPLYEGLARDLDVVEAVCGHRPAVVCAHKPLRNGDPEVTPEQLGELGVRSLQLEGERYASDSARGFRDESLEMLDALGKDPARTWPAVRFNMHPVWWAAEAPRLEVIQERINSLTQGLVARATRDWAKVDEHPNAAAQDARDKRSGNPARRARAGAKVPTPAPGGNGHSDGGVVLPHGVLR